MSMEDTLWALNRVGQLELENDRLRNGIEKLITDYATIGTPRPEDHCEDLRQQLIKLLGEPCSSEAETKR